MNLIARPTEQAIRAAAHRALRAEPAAWREFKRRRQRIKPLVWKGTIYLMLASSQALTLFCLLRGALPARAGWAALFLFFSLCSTIVMMSQVALNRIQHLQRLPIADRDIFRVVWWDFMFAAVISLPVFWFLFNRLIPGGGRSEIWIQAGAAVLLASAMVASLCIVRAWLHADAWAPGVARGAFFMFMGGWQMTRDDGFPLIRDMVDQIAMVLRLGTPPGWVITWFIERGHGEAEAARWLAPVAVSLVLAWPAWRQLRDKFVVAEAAPNTPQMTPVQAMQLAQVAQRNELAVPHLHGATAIEESLKAREFLTARPGLAQGWLDRLIWNRLTERERTLLDFMLLVRPRWAQAWLRGLMCAAGGLLVSLALRPSRPDLHWLAAALGGGVLGIMALPLTNGLSRAFGVCPVAGGAPVTFVGCLPIGYREVFRLELKISLVRTLAALPLVVTFGCLFAWHINASPWLGGFIALKACLGVLLLRPFMVTLFFSFGTNDSQLSKWRGWVMLGAVLFTAFTSISLGVASVTMAAWWSWLMLAGVGLLNWGFHCFHRRRYNRMSFDLQPSTLIGQHPVG